MSYRDRQKRYRKRHPEKYAASMRRHSEAGGTIPGDFGGHKRGRIPWDALEEARVIEHSVPDRQLAEELGRTQKAIIARRSQIKRRGGGSE